MIVDSHHHFWHYTPAEFDWVGDDRLRKNFLPGDFAPVLRSAGVAATIAVQARQSEDETKWLLNLAEQNANIAGVVGWVPLTWPGVEDRLAAYNQSSALVGVRHVLQAEADDSYMLRADFNRGVALLTQFEIAYDLLILPRHLPTAIEFVDRHPRQVFVVDHLAKPLEGGAEAQWRCDIRRLAERPNVYCKLAAGMIECCPAETSFEKVRPFFDIAMEAFGPTRLMFGSNWPLTEVAGGYEDWLNIVRRWAGPLSNIERDAIFSGTARDAYRLPDRT